MPLTRSRDYSPAPDIDPEEQKRREKRRRQFQMILEDAADEQEAVLITVLKDLGRKDFGNSNNGGPVQGYLIRFIVLTGEHAGHVEDELPMYKRGFTSRIDRAGVGATFVARLERYGDRSPRAIGLTDDRDGDVELAEKALAKFGDPFEDAAPGQVAEEVAQAKRNGKAAAKKAAEADDDNPPF